MPIIQDCVFALPDSYGYLKAVRPFSLFNSLHTEFFDYQSFQIIFQSDFFLSTSESLLNHGNLYSISHRKNYLKQVFVYDNRQCTFYEHPDHSKKCLSAETKKHSIRFTACTAIKQTVIFIAQDRNSQRKHSRYLTYDSAQKACQTQ